MDTEFLVGRITRKVRSAAYFEHGTQHWVLRVTAATWRCGRDSGERDRVLLQGECFVLNAGEAFPIDVLGTSDQVR